MALAFVSNSRVSMQRAGMLTAACLAASDEVTNMARVTRRFGDIVRRHVAIDATNLDAVETYLRSLRLWKRYGHLRAIEKLSVGEQVELQDLWLADERLPSATGAVTTEVIEDIPQLATTLRLLRDGNLTRTDRARALVASYGPGTLEPVVAGSGTEPNLLVLPTAAKLVLAYALLEADGDFLQSAWATTPVVEQGDWSRADFATGLKDACEDLVARARRRMTTSADRQAIARLNDWAQEIAKGRGSGRNWGGGRPPDQLATLRLEPFVDLGLITRVDRASYRYRLSPEQASFFSELAGAERTEAFAREALVRGWLATTGSRRQPASEEAIWAYTRKAYDELKSRLGFAPFVEVVLLAIGRLIDEDPHHYFEIQHGIDVLTEQRRLDPKVVRLTISRGGQLTYMKLAPTKR